METLKNITLHHLPPFPMPERVDYPYPKAVEILRPTLMFEEEMHAQLKQQQEDLIHQIRKAEDIQVRIHLMYRDFLSRYAIVPNTLFMHREDYYHLLKVVNYQELESGQLYKFIGMEIKLTELDKTYVALVAEQPEDFL